MLINNIYQILPPRTRLLLKRVLGCRGHSISLIDKLRASKDAEGKRRLDNALEHFLSTTAHFGTISLGGNIAMDFGSGYVPIDSIILWLLGADRVIAVDYNRVACWEALNKSITITDESNLRTICKKYCIDESTFFDRLNHIKKIRFGSTGFDFNEITYSAPFDVTNLEDVELNENVDFIWSTSVLEHIHPSQMLNVLNGMSKILNNEGRMIHFVDTRDHLNLVGDPFGFFDNCDDYNADRDYDERGNRMQYSDYLQVFSKVSDITVKFKLLWHQDGSPRYSKEYHEYLLIDAVRSLAV